jgi:hypothetical protein
MKRNRIIDYRIGLSILAALTFSVPSFAKIGDIKANKEAIQSSLKYLSDDKLEGREPGTKGGVDAAEFIKNKFKEYGLKSFDADYFRNFKFLVGIHPTGDSKLKIGEHALELNKQWTPLAFSEVVDISGEDIIFCGYGVSSDKINYDDYKDIDAKGKVVLVLCDSSLTGDSREHFLDNYSSARYKAMNAHTHGAKAVILVKRDCGGSDNLFAFDMDRFSNSSGTACVQISRSAAEKIFGAKVNFNALEKKIDETKQSASFVIGDIKCDLKTNFKKEQKDVPNVVGYVPGSDASLKDEYIVLGAHYDHLGWGKFSSTYRGDKLQIHNGADDNASGTSSIIELASMFSKSPAKRPIVFVAFNCEEEGLLGSAAFVNDSPMPLKDIAAMFNFDMVGRLRDRTLYLMGVGSSDMISKTADSLAKIDNFSISRMSEGFAPSDQSSFYAANIPVLMFFTGLHDDYHSPSDDYDKINFDGMADITNYAESVIRTIANSDKRPDFKVATNSFMPKKDEKEKSKGMSGGSGVWFGLVPSFGECPEGMKIAGTSEGSPAKAAGLTKDDIIIEFAGKPMKSLYDFNYELREHKPGDKVKVKYIRDKKTYEVEVELKKKK